MCTVTALLSYYPQAYHLQAPTPTYFFLKLAPQVEQRKGRSPQTSLFFSVRFCFFSFFLSWFRTCSIQLFFLTKPLLQIEQTKGLSFVCNLKCGCNEALTKNLSQRGHLYCATGFFLESLSTGNIISGSV
jgi:hypothetical protein